MTHPTAQSSIRTRLILIPSCILALGIAAAVGVTLYGAKARIQSEMASGLTLGGHLIGYALDDLAKAGDAQAQREAMRRLRDGLASVRHVRVAFRNGAEDAQAPQADAPQTPAAPRWFAAALRPPTIVRTYPVTIGGERHGEIVMSSEPADETAEIWSSLVFLTALLTAVSAAIVILIIMTARRTLAPLTQLVDGLDRLGRGQFGLVGEIRIAELKRIGEHFNRLSATLAQAEADNRLLIDRLMSIQDAERKELARELHDEFGASLFGIRAAASCIVEEAREGALGPQAQREIIERAHAISALADGIQKQNYRILDRIRPGVLRQMGLADALRQLVEAFRAQHRDIACVIEAAPELTGRRFEEEASLTAYRIVQECLTNVARHSGAKSARVAMSEAADPAGGMKLRLVVEDDGVGPPEPMRHGFGLLGMSERARKHGGRLSIGAGAQGGMRIEACIPLRTPAPPDPAAPGRRLGMSALS